MEIRANAPRRQDYSEAPPRRDAPLPNCAILFGWHLIFGDVHLGHHNALFLILHEDGG